jgi:hypothetical protein
MEYVKVVCDAGCGGTGLYQGFMEGKGRYVVCVGCGGKGYQKAKSFVKRVRQPGASRPGIEILVRGTASIIESNNPKTAMTYAEFLKRYPE